MVQSQFSVSWDAYKSSICGGFSSLQQNGEFVDMTLAADGHYVKVHQVLMALVSPYLKELITSAPCQHPVIFLNNVSHRTLSALLEYIYTGEVMVPSDSLSSFVETAKSLHIKGLEDMTKSENMSLRMADNTSMMESGEMCHVSGTKKVPLLSEGGIEEIDLPAAARKIVVKTHKFLKSGKKSKPPAKESTRDIDAYDDVMDDSGALDDDDDYHSPIDSSQKSESGPVDPKDPGSSNLQYSVSIRGALQVILNRYIYNLQSTQHRTGIRRWRCIQYRNNRCMAFLVTKGNVVLNRANLHNHSFHDKKILQKIEKNSIFSALDDVQGYKEKETEEKDTDDNDSSVEPDYVQALNQAISDDVKKQWSVKLQ